MSDTDPVCAQCGHDEAWHRQPHARPRHIYKPTSPDRDELLAAAAATMPEVAHSGEELPSPDEVLNLPLHPNYDPGLGTIRGYLAGLAAAVWDENEGFSGKRPFGNSGWSADLEAALVQAGVIDGGFTERGFLEHADTKAADRIIRSAVKAMGHPAPQPDPVLLTEDEHEAIRQAGELANLVCRIIGDGPAADNDRAEAVESVHRVQRMIAAQAAARAFPERYRLLGGTLTEEGGGADG